MRHHSRRWLTIRSTQSQDEIHVNTVVVDWPGVTELNANLAAGTPPDIMVLHAGVFPITPRAVV